MSVKYSCVARRRVHRRGPSKGILARSWVDMRKELHRSLQMHPGCGWRVSVLTGSVEEIGSGGFRIHFGPALEPCFLRSGAVPAA
jgi:hypothetical protein